MCANNFLLLVNMNKGFPWAAAVWTVLGISVAVIFFLVLAGTFSDTSHGRAVLQYFDKEFLSMASEYHLAGMKIFLLRQVVTWIFFISMAILAWRYFHGAPQQNLLLVAGYVALIFVVLYLLTFPLDFYRGFTLEHRFQLSNHSLSSWMGEYVLSKGVSLFFSVLAFTGLYLLTVYLLSRWWLAAGIFFAVFLILAAYLSPIIIDPLFYRFEPLKDREMYTQIIGMSERAGVKIDEVLVADASRKTGKVNAYFTGVGKTKRIVIFDTLLQRFSREEVLAVIAHEMGHWKHGHIGKGLFIGIAGAFLSLFLFQAVLKGMGVPHGDIRVIPLAILFFGLISFVSLPFQNAVSRAFERQADREAVTLARDPDTLVLLKQNLALNNLAEVSPHPFIKIVLYSHPPIIERINFITEEGKKR